MSDLLLEVEVEVIESDVLLVGVGEFVIFVYVLVLCNVIFVVCGKCIC